MSRTLRALPGVDAVRRHGPEVQVEGTGPLLAHVGAHLVALGRPPLDLRVERPSLEDRFVALTQEHAHDHDRHSTTAPSTPPAAPAPSRTVAPRSPAPSCGCCGVSPGVLVGLIGFPAVTVLVLAGVFGSTPDPDFGGVVPSEHYVVGYVGVVLASMGLVTLPAMLASTASRASLRRYRGVRCRRRERWSPATSPSAPSSARWPAPSCCGRCGDLRRARPEDPLAVIAWFVAGLACFIAIGGALGVLMPSSRAASALGNLVFVPMFLLGGGGPPARRDDRARCRRSPTCCRSATSSAGSASRGWAGPTTRTRCCGRSSSP